MKIENALMQRMTDFCQIVSMSRLFETLEWRVFRCPTLRNLTVPCMGLLKFSLFEAVEKSVKYIIRAIKIKIWLPLYFLVHSSYFLLLTSQKEYLCKQGHESQQQKYAPEGFALVTLLDVVGHRLLCAGGDGAIG